MRKKTDSIQLLFKRRGICSYRFNNSPETGFKIAGFIELRPAKITLELL
jgi:hypothetical protein